MYMLSLARVYVAVGAGALDDNDITDERRDEAVCGIFIASADSALAAAQTAQKTADAAQTTANAAKAAASSAQTTANNGVTNAASALAEAQKKIPKVTGAAKGDVPLLKSDGTIESSGTAWAGFHRCKFALNGTTLTITTVT